MSTKTWGLLSIKAVKVVYTGGIHWVVSSCALWVILLPLQGILLLRRTSEKCSLLYGLPWCRRRYGHYRSLWRRMACRNWGRCYISNFGLRSYYRIRLCCFCMSTSKIFLDYTDAHDVDENVRAIPEQGGRWHKASFAGIMERDLSDSPTNYYNIVASYVWTSSTDSWWVP